MIEASHVLASGLADADKLNLRGASSSLNPGRD